jgi:hypothetical protein
MEMRDGNSNGVVMVWPVGGMVMEIIMRDGNANGIIYYYGNTNAITCQLNLPPNPPF